MSPRPFFATLAAVALLAPLTVNAQSAPAAEPAPVAPVAPAAPSTPPLAPSPNLAPTGDIVATLKGSPHFSILAKALDLAQLSAVVSGTPGLTLFAPTDEAFKALPPAQLSALLSPSNAPILQKLLIYHLVNATIDGGKIKGAKGPMASVEASNLNFDGTGDVLKVNDASIIQADVKTSNGIIHVVDKVLVPADITLPSVSAAVSTTPNG